MSTSQRQSAVRNLCCAGRQWLFNELLQGLQSLSTLGNSAQSKPAQLQCDDSALSCVFLMYSLIHQGGNHSTCHDEHTSHKMCVINASNYTQDKLSCSKIIQGRHPCFTTGHTLLLPTDFKIIKHETIKKTMPTAMGLVILQPGEMQRQRFPH